MPSELRVDKVSSTASPYTPVFSTTGGALSHRNLIINGAMQVAQRGTGFSAVTATGYQLDRFQTSLQGLGAYTITQNTTAPTSEGFAQSYKIDCTSADASPGAADFLFIAHKMEGQNLQQLCKGTSSAKSVTLSFWCRCTKTGNIQVNLNDYDNTRIIGQAVSINSADTWEYKTLTFAGDTSGVLANDNGASLAIEWWLDKGSNFSGGSVPTSWEALNSADRAVGCTLALGDNTANDFYLTGVQLELGSVATPFEHRSYGDELQRCKRYYQELFGDGYDYHAQTVWFPNTSAWSMSLMYPEEMRATPSGNIVGTAVGTNGGSVSATKWAVFAAGAWKGCSAITLTSLSPVSTRVDGNTNTSVSAGTAGGLYGGTGCYVTLNAEL